MGLVARQVLAERVSGLKKLVPVETPVVDQIPVPAKSIMAEALSLGRIEGIIPIIARGTAYGETSGAWYRVTFPRALANPSVVAIAQGRGGTIPTPRAPSISILTVGVGVASAPVSSAGVPAAASIVVPSARKGHVPTSLGRFGCGFAIASLTDGLNDLVITLESVLRRMNEVVDDLYSGLEKTRSSLTSLNTKVDDLRTKVNSAFSDTTSRVNSALETLRRNTESATNTGIDRLRRNTESSVNSGLAAVLPLLYSAWGIPANMAVTPLHVRNITSTGFEFQSYGKTTCHYIAMGSLR